MAFGTQGIDLTFNVSPNSAGFGQYVMVKLDTAGGSALNDVIVGAANTDSCLGVCQDAGGPATTLGGAEANNTAGMSVRVRTFGVSKIQCASAVTRGDLLVCGAAGQVATAPALAATTVRIVGIALDTTSAQGDLVSAFIFPMASSIANA